MTLRSRAPSARVGLVVVAAFATVLVSAVLISFTLAAPTATTQTLVVTDANGTELVTAPVSAETEIVIEYTHSVERTLVRDVYVATEDGTLVMARMEFSSFGAGLPAQADVTREGGRYVYEPPSTEYETLRVQTGHVADHDLIVNDDRHDVAALTDGGPVELTIENR